MRIHYLQHVPFENPGHILRWAENKGHKITSTHLYNDTQLPDPAEFDWLIVMGGPMSVHDTKDFYWLRIEKDFIKTCIELNKTIFGICLGAQLIAEALGAEVNKNKYKEIGWFPIRINHNTDTLRLWDDLSVELAVFHWHGETFTLPSNAMRLASSDACQNQAFLVGKRILGLQFHLESTEKGVNNLIENCGDDMTPGPYVQSPDTIIKSLSNTIQNQAVMSSVLNYLESVTVIS